MRILMLNPFFSPYAGGTEKHVYEVGRRLARHHDVTVLTARLPDTPKTETIEGICVVRSKAWVLDDLPKPLIPPIPVMPEHHADLKRLVATADVVHAHNRFFYGLDLVSATKKAGKPLYLTLHNARPAGIDRSTDFWGQAYDDTIGKTIMNACRGILGVSQNTLDVTLPKKYAGKTAVAYNGVDTDTFRPHRTDVKAQLGVGRMVLCVARFVPQKGIKYLIDAMAGIDADLVLLGRGPLEKKLREYAKKTQGKKNIGGSGGIVWPGKKKPRDAGDATGTVPSAGRGRIHFVTSVIPEEKLADHYAAADVFCFPSLWEPFGMAACEAMASGVPVVASRVGGLPEIIDDGQDGFLVPAKNAAALGEKIRWLLENPEKARKMGLAARKKIVGKFTWDKTAEAYGALYARTSNP